MSNSCIYLNLDLKSQGGIESTTRLISPMTYKANFTSVLAHKHTTLLYCNKCFLLSKTTIQLV